MSDWLSILLARLFGIAYLRNILFWNCNFFARVYVSLSHIFLLLNSRWSKGVYWYLLCYWFIQGTKVYLLYPLSHIVWFHVLVDKASFFPSFLFQLPVILCLWLLVFLGLREVNYKIHTRPRHKIQKHPLIWIKMFLGLRYKVSLVPFQCLFFFGYIVLPYCLSEDSLHVGTLYVCVFIIFLDK